MTDSHMPSKKEEGGAKYVVYVGLYLILLAFFILLIGISTFEEKRTQAVVGSITSTFQAGLTDGTGLDAELLPTALAQFLSAQAFQRKLEDLFRSLLPHSEVRMSRPGELMHVVFPVDVLFPPRSDVLRIERFPLLRRIAAALDDHPPDQRFDIEFDDMGYLEDVDRLSTPILLFHGDSDDRIPVETSDELADARPDLVMYERVPGAEHVHAWNIDPERYESAVESFLGVVAGR